jgi:hypothetical protein
MVSDLFMITQLSRRVHREEVNRARIFFLIRFPNIGICKMNLSK